MKGTLAVTWKFVVWLRAGDLALMLGAHPHIPSLDEFSAASRIILMYLPISSHQRYRKLSKAEIRAMLRIGNRIISHTRIVRLTIFWGTDQVSSLFK